MLISVYFNADGYIMNAQNYDRKEQPSVFLFSNLFFQHFCNFQDNGIFAEIQNKKI